MKLKIDEKINITKYFRSQTTSSMLLLIITVAQL